VGFIKRSFDTTKHVAQSEVGQPRCAGFGHISRKAKQQEIVMTHDNNKEGSSVLYWIMLATMFGAFIAVALS
jgi:hypothetical protein